MRAPTRALAVATGLVVAFGLVWPASPAVADTVPGGGPSTSGTTATRARQARHELVDPAGHPVDGSGSSIVIIDTGVDPSHPSFQLPGGSSKVVRMLSTLGCTVETYVDQEPACIRDLPTNVDSDTGHGGHGGFASSVALGNELTLADGTHVDGTAPGAKLVMISTTAALVAVENAFNWVIRNHAAPCGAGVPASTCPPIRVVSCSWGANSPVITAAEKKLAAAGVLVVWANGNQGGDGSKSNSNPGPSVDPTPGVLTVGSYDDKGTGTRDGDIDPGSSKGKANDANTWPDVSAPGINILGACRPTFAICDAIGKNPKDGPGPNDVATFFVASGTSWAAPTVAGVVTMLFQVRPTATAAQIDDALKVTAYKYRSGGPYQQVGAYTSSFDKGVGLVDAYAAAVRLGARPRPAAAAGAVAASATASPQRGGAPATAVQGARQSRSLAATGSPSWWPAAALAATVVGLLGLLGVRRTRARTGRGRPA